MIGVLRTQSLRRKLVIVALITTGLTLIASNMAFISLEYYLARQDVERKLNILGEVIANRATAALTFGDFDLLKTRNARSTSFSNALNVRKLSQQFTPSERLRKTTETAEEDTNSVYSKVVPVPTHKKRVSEMLKTMQLDKIKISNLQEASSLVTDP